MNTLCTDGCASEMGTAVHLLIVGIWRQSPAYTMHCSVPPILPPEPDHPLAPSCCPAPCSTSSLPHDPVLLLLIIVSLIQLLLWSGTSEMVQDFPLVLLTPILFIVLFMACLGQPALYRMEYRILPKDTIKLLALKKITIFQHLKMEMKQSFLCDLTSGVT